MKISTEQGVICLHLQPSNRATMQIGLNVAFMMTRNYSNNNSMTCNGFDQRVIAQDPDGHIVDASHAKD
jgi:hypothetical protein